MCKLQDNIASRVEMTWGMTNSENKIKAVCHMSSTVSCEALFVVIEQENYLKYTATIFSDFGIYSVA